MGNGIEIRLETFAQAWPEGDELGALHAREVEGELQARRPYKVDAKAIAALCEAGIWKCLVARLDGVMVGYCTWNVVDDLESEGLKIALQGAWFVRPEARFKRVGLRLFQRSIHELRLLGVKNMFPHHRLLGSGKGLGRYFSRLGAIEIQHTYSLWIGD